ncbi:baseplate [Kosakonia phage Kc304]|uniref:Baseplate hub assembly catalyst n=2 Tax=Winklervirus chi14 TaxID=2560752 RepID=A0A1Z1LYI1_9CAUD|nr:baseplate hub assembly catalyst [Serratia phage CHI14]ARW57616.1 baseplate hub assembly catalyst [Serratia phage CHI14]ARW57891.1 baseplate hub assembly catalyst [Serratia phage CBH8]QYN80638.1 baseplate [Kosakonia phage Kc304]
MANIVRCKLPDGVHRFKPFTVADYRDFLLVRNDMNTKSKEEQIELIDELLADYFDEYPKSWRPYIFISVFTSSIGKTKIPVSFECPTCGAKKRFMLNLSQEPLVAPVIETSGIKIKFKYPDEINEDLVELISKNIDTVQDSDSEYKWSELDDETKVQVIDSIDYKAFESLVKKLKPLHIEVSFKCCSEYKFVYDSLIDIFKILLNPDEVFSFYQVNHLLVKSHYDLNSVMAMIPIERSIALSLVEKDLKK